MNRHQPDGEDSSLFFFVRWPLSFVYCVHIPYTHPPHPPGAHTIVECDIWCDVIWHGLAWPGLASLGTIHTTFSFPTKTKLTNAKEIYITRILQQDTISEFSPTPYLAISLRPLPRIPHHHHFCTHFPLAFRGHRCYCLCVCAISARSYLLSNIE